MPATARRLKIETSVDGYFVGNGPWDDSGFVTNAMIENAQDYLEAAGMPEVQEETIAVILASRIRGRL